MPRQSMGENRAQLVQLEPFLHQVGGHSSVLRFDEHTIGKPLIAREHLFYETLPVDLEPFTPQYKGVSEVTILQDNGHFFLLSHPPHTRKRWSDNSMAGSDTDVQSDPETRSPHSSNEQLEAIPRSGSLSEPRRPQHLRTTSLDGQHTRRVDCNPWSLRLHKSHMEKMYKNSSQTFKFIMLENLTTDLTLPCILDLKMGTRLHGDDATEEKRSRQLVKCEQSTSKSLGFRIGGMQVYQGDKLVNYDKYRGRALDVDGVKQGLREFLHNGTHLLVPLINPIISRLRQLKEVIVRHDTFRFYSSSLLIIYDGCDWSNYGSASSDVHSQCTDADSCDSTSRSMSASPNADHNKMPEPAEGDDWSQVAAAYRFDVRMIDFAHVTFRGFNERDTAHDGPDHGYLFGLDKLIETLTEISDNDKQITG